MRIQDMAFKKSLPTLLLTSILASTLVACGGGGSSSDNATSTDGKKDDSNQGDDSELTTNAGIAKNFVDNLASPAFNNFAVDSKKLPAAIKKYCENIDSNRERVNAQKIWADLESQWQATNIYHVGVLAENYNKLAKNIYTNNFLADGSIDSINAQVNKYKNNSALQITDKTAFNVRGLDTLEYLLFDDRANNKDSCNYAELVAKNIEDNAKVIADSWDADRNNLLTTTQSNAVDLVQPFFDNVVEILDKDLKDTDLGVPLAVKVGGSCKSICAEKAEHHISGNSYASIKANLQSLKDVFDGKGDKGFKVYYEQNKMSTQADNFLAKVNTAIATIDAQETSLYNQLIKITDTGKENACRAVVTTGKTDDSDLAPCKLYYEIKQLSDEVKSGSFKMAINLDLPDSAAGDGD